MIVDRTIRGLDSELLDDISHACIDTKRHQGDILNDAMALWLREYNRKKEKKHHVHKS